MGLSDRLSWAGFQQLTTDGRPLFWDLAFEPDGSPTSPMPQILERVAPAFYANPNLDARASGDVTIGDRTLTLEGEPLGQSHIWGRHHAGRWAWCHLHVTDGFTIEAVQARPHAPGSVERLLPERAFVLVRLAGHDYRFGMLAPGRARGRIEFPVWHLLCSSGDLRIHVSVRAPLERLVQVTYHDPSGEEAYCANTEVGDAAVEVYRRYGPSWRCTEVHDLRGRAHMEFGARTPYAEVPVSF
jgi:hypothetical protein